VRELRFALSYEDLKIRGREKLKAISCRVSAIRRVSSLPSITQGPAIRAKELFPPMTIF
jgi:hypothetical protein